nr:hypothetical protein GCM10020093_004380 [Planobispora longispora]
MFNSKRQGKLAAVAVMAVTALTLTSCGSEEPTKPSAGGGSSAPAEPVTITVHTFGGGENFGYDKAVEKWNAEHPNIQVKYQNLTDRFEDVYLPQLLQKLQAGSGTADIVGIDEGAMGLMAQRPQFFTDLGQYGLDSRKAEFPAAKWENGINKDGKLFALGTDIGGMAMCYRKDLFEKAACRATARRSASSGRTGTPSWRPARSSRRRSPTPSSSTARTPSSTRSCRRRRRRTATSPTSTRATSWSSRATRRSRRPSTRSSPSARRA